MKHRTQKRISGFFPVTVTPFESDGSLAEEAFATILAWHIAQGAEGLTIGADNGEASLLSLTERKRMAEIAVQVAGGRIPIVMGAIGTHAFTAKDTARMIDVAAAAGIDAALVSPAPYLGGGTRAEIVGRYREIYQAVPLPIVAYNNPRHFGAPVEGDTLQALIDEVDIAGVKQSSRNFLDISNEIARFSDRVSFFMGCGYLMMPGIAVGATGIMSTGIDLLGREAATVISRARGPWNHETRALHLKIARAYTFMLETGTPPAALKAALNLIGLPAGQPRPPAMPLEEADYERLTSLLSEIGALNRDVSQVAALPT